MVLTSGEEGGSNDHGASPIVEEQEQVSVQETTNAIIASEKDLIENSTTACVLIPLNEGGEEDEIAEEIEKSARAIGRLEDLDLNHDQLMEASRVICVNGHLEQISEDEDEDEEIVEQDLAVVREAAPENNNGANANNLQFDLNELPPLDDN